MGRGVPLGGHGGDRVSYTLEFPPLVVETLGVFNPIVHACWEVWEPIDLFEDFRVYGSAEIVDCGFHVKFTFCCGD